MGRLRCHLTEVKSDSSNENGPFVPTRASGNSHLQHNAVTCVRQSPADAVGTRLPDADHSRAKQIVRLRRTCDFPIGGFLPS
jgi:hypothetical protein